MPSGSRNAAHHRVPSAKGLPTLAGFLPGVFDIRKDIELRTEPQPLPRTDGSSEESRTSASGVSADAGEGSGECGGAAAPALEPEQDM
jgi:hypothetical protein